mgnify:CR=1 FL=1
MSSNSGSVTQVYGRLLKYVQQFWFVFAIAIVGNIVYSGVDAFFVYFLKPVLDKGFIGRDATFLAWLPVMIVLVFILRAVAGVTSTYCMAYVSRNVIMIMRQKLFAHFQQLPATFYDKTTSGTLLSNLIYNVEQVANASANAITMALQAIVLIIGLLVVMFTISWQITLFYFLIIPIIGIVMQFTNKRMRSVSHALQHSMADTTNAAEENIEGYKEVRAFGGGLFEIGRFKRFTSRNRHLEMKNVIVKAVANSSVQFVAAAALSITVYLATSGVMGDVLTAGGFIALIGSMLAILKPFKNLTSVNNAIQRGVVGAQSVFALLDQEVEVDRGAKALVRANGDIEIQDVSFAYNEGDKQVLSNFNLAAKKGEVIALVGHSGGGKSTLVSLLPRFYDGYEGSFMIDGIDTREFRLADLRKQFALVSQHVVLFNDTILHNIAYGVSDELDKEAVYKAARLAHADEFIKGLSNGYDTLIGENGVLLSGGQRQRIAIARAIYKNAPFLILDEATSALDTVSERHIQAGLESLMQGRTTFVIAHRLSTIEHADKIVVMQGGQIVESGAHAELLALGGVYAGLHSMQFKEK